MPHTLLAVSLFTTATLALFAQTPDGLAGTSGWVGAGLLGAVLSWLLLVHLPARDKLDREKDERLKAWIEAKDKQISEIVANHVAAVDKVTSANLSVQDKIITHHQLIDERKNEVYERGLANVLKHCQEEFSDVNGAVKEELTGVGKTMLEIQKSLNVLQIWLQRNQSLLPKDSQP